MKVSTLLATVATFTGDLSYARSIGRREASNTIILPIQKHFRPVAGSTLSTGYAQTNILSQVIRTRHDSNSRRAILEDQSEDKSEEDAQEPPKALDTSEESTTDLGQDYSGEYGRSSITNEEEYATRLPPFRSADGTELDHLDFSATPISAFNPLIPDSVSMKNLNINLVPPVSVSSGDTGMYRFASTPVLKDSTLGTKVGFLPNDESVNGNDATNQKEVNSVSSKTVEKPSDTNGEVTKPKKQASSATKVEATRPETPIGDQKEESADSDGRANPIAGSKDTDQSPDKAVEKVKSDGTPVVVKIYLYQTTGEKGKKKYEVIKAIDDEPADSEAPTAHSQENKAEVVAKTKPEWSGDEKPKMDEDVQPVKKQKSTSDKPSTELEKEKSDNTPEKGSTNQETMPKKTEKEDSSTEPDKENSDNTPNQKTTQKKAEKEEPSSEKLKNGDDKAFDLTEAEKDAIISTLSSPTAIEEFRKTSLPADMIDLINRKGDPGKEPQDVSNSISSASEQKKPQRRWTRVFRA